MNKIVFKNGTKLEFNKIEGLNIIFIDKTVEELENVFTKENCSKLQLTTENGEVYGVHNNLECVSITKNVKDYTVTVHLKELDSTNIRLGNLEGAVAELGSVINELSEGGVK